MKKILSAMVIIVLVGAMPNFAQKSSFTLKLGIFNPSMDSDLWSINMENLALNKSDMQDIYYGFEYEFFMGKNASLSFECGYYKKEHYTQYLSYGDYEFGYDDPIYQNIGLRITSFEFGGKIYPVGIRTKFYPYIQAGAGLYAWKYEQWGEFVDGMDEEYIYTHEGYAYTEKYTLGMNAKIGLAFRANRSMGFVFETRYQYIKGELSSLFEGFEKLDLGGLSFIIGLNFIL